MFRKKDPSLEVILGPESSIKGELITKGGVRIDGTVDGAVRADWLIVGEAGSIKGDVESRGTVINGKIQGNLTSGEVVEIKSRGSVEGDIHTAKLIISEGAFFDGRSYMQRPAESGDKDILSFEQKAKKSV